jgi:hypothetical protein
MKMKKISIALLTVCSWTLPYAQSINPTSNIGASLATISSSSGININGAVNVSAPQIPKNSNIVISTSAASSLPNIVNTSSSITPRGNTNVTISTVSATTTPNITSISTAPVIRPASAIGGKLVVTKTITTTFHKPEIPKPDVIVNLYKSSHPQPPKAPSVQTFSLASVHNQESIVQLSNKVNLVVTSEGLGTDLSTASTAQLVDAIASPYSLQDKQLTLSMLKH